MSEIDNLAPPAPVDKTFSYYAQWAIALASAAAAMVLPFMMESPVFILIALLLCVPFAFIHCIQRYGWKLFLIFFVVTFIISNAFENMSVMTGFPFGNYHYTGDPKLFYVPIQIGPIYFSIGYVCWLIASTIFDRADEHLNLNEPRGRINVVILPMLSAALMTAFDVGNDSRAATILQAWVWEDGGGLFGVPYTNYLGWWFVTYAYFQIFALILARQSQPSIKTHGPMLPAVLIYLAVGLCSVSYFIVKAGDTSTVADQTGQIWGVSALAETLMIINLFSVVIFALIAFAKIAKGDAGLSR